ncbi:MAG TPA: hypothetical protein VGR20_16345 [Acidimicrobiia bacterium]|nr:hypothetical protein [Acidimicrobiia bacterium]
MEEARALMTEALTGIDRDSLLAERAEAEAQLRAAEATLGNPPPANGRGAAEQEAGRAAENPEAVDNKPVQNVRTLDVDALRRAAGTARAADDELARAASEAANRPLPSETELGTAESSFARALEVREELPAAWRRLVGALISATGMAIVIGALGWNVYWLLVPIALIAVMTVDLRVAGQAAREASTQAARELASVGVAGADGLDRIRLARTRIDEAEGRLATARAARDAAYARFEQLAPGHRPSEVEAIVTDYEAELNARAVRAHAERAEAERAAAERTDAERAAAERTAAERTAAERTAAVEMAPESPVLTPRPAAKADWWFTPEKAPETSRPPAPPVTADPAPPPAPVRALAERLSAEGREALARIEAQLAALDRVELAKKSLEWHEARSEADDPPGVGPA